MWIALRSSAITAFLCLVAAISFAQTIKGVVKNLENGEGISAASIVLKGSTQGAVANEQGEFQITVSSLPVTLTISSVNFETQDISVTGSTFLTVSLKPMLGQEIVAF